MFIKAVSSQILKYNLIKLCRPGNIQIQKRAGSYKTSPIFDETKKYTDYEIIQNPEEWKYVERLLPLKWIPEPKPKESYPSGFRPQTADPGKSPYFIERTKNYMLPVYLKIAHRGNQRLTKLRRVEGDIWKLSEDLVAYIKPYVKEDRSSIGIQVDELKRLIILRGDFVQYVKRFLIEKGF